MTAKELVDKILSIEGVTISIKSVEYDKTLIFSYERKPIATIDLKGFDYNVEYDKLFELDLNDILQINDWMYQYVHTDLSNRNLEMFFLS